MTDTVLHHNESPAVDFNDAVKLFYKKYAVFNGRASRAEYWYPALFIFTITLALGITGAVFGLFSTSLQTIFGVVSLLFSLSTFVPSLAVMVRRFHDIDRSGWWSLIIFIPLIGFIVFIVWVCKRGTFGPNRFGPDPLAL